MRKHRIVRAGAAEMASALLLLLALSATLIRVATDEAGEQVAPPSPPITAAIEVDATVPVGGAAGRAAEGLEIAAPEDGKEPWWGWAWLDGRRWRAECDNTEVRVVAAAAPDSVAVAVYNPTDAPALLRLNVRLRAGRYTIDRLTFGPSGMAGRRIERLQCGVLAGAGVSRKSGFLQPGEGAVYRYVNYASMAASSYRRAAQRCRTYRAANATASRRLLVALRELPFMIERAGRLMSQRDASPALRYVHRALLGVRHAQAVCGNSGGSGKAARALLEQISSALAELEAALGECSVAALGLIPSASVDAQSTAPDGKLAVEVRVRNGGASSVTAVKLWVTGPPGARIEPEDQAVFGTLKPGQTATAQFSMKPKESSAAGGATHEALLGHLSYYRGQAPAHVRIAAR